MRFQGLSPSSQSGGVVTPTATNAWCPSSLGLSPAPSLRCCLMRVLLPLIKIIYYSPVTYLHHSHLSLSTL